MLNSLLGNLQKSKKGTWAQALVSFLFPLLLVLGIRWALIEPFVIPSGSMIPTLLVHDSIIVTKFSYGLKWPFTSQWIHRWSQPQAGDVVVFRYPENPDVFYIKRLIAVPGDDVRISSGRIVINGKAIELQPADVKGDAGYFYFWEQIGRSKHLVRFQSLDEQGPELHYKIPNGKYFFMGDNRDESSDSRVWGFADESLLIGKAFMIWLSCDQTLATNDMLCDPSQMRWSRMFKTLQ